jgi:hypothetical protein
MLHVPYPAIFVVTESLASSFRQRVLQCSSNAPRMPKHPSDPSSHFARQDLGDRGKMAVLLMRVLQSLLQCLLFATHRGILQPMTL